MKKIIISIIVVGLLLTSSMVTVNAISGYDGVELLWKNSDDVGDSDFTSIFSSDINYDDFPDVLVNRSALDGGTGELIWTAEAGKICGVGDINNDGIDEVITKESRTICCLDGTNGEIIWEHELDSSRIFSVSVGNVTGDENNEVIIGTGYSSYLANNSYVYCLDGTSGNRIWRKHADDYVLCTAIADVNADGENEVIAGTSSYDRRVYCLDGDNGDIIWEFEPPDWNMFRVLCIGDLNDDPYKEIVVEMYWDDDQVEGVCCLSGNDGSIVWIWNGSSGLFQSILIADMIPSIPGNEVIVGGSLGTYCLHGGDNAPPSGREIWHYYNGGVVISAAVGDLDQDGLLDVTAITVWNPMVYALKGQDGSLLWEYEGCTTDYGHSIICTDLTGDGFPEVIAKDNSYVCALLSYSLQNLAPQTPVIDGPTTGDAGTPYDFSFNTTDPDGDNLYYYVDWGDNQRSWFGPYPSGEEATVSHTWSEQGTYTIKAKARDIHGAESDWDYLEVEMPVNQPSTNQQLLKTIFQQPMSFKQNTRSPLTN